ncbi:protease PrsW [Actinomyces respiraculi]|uniref:Protease PrsW n=1 Tax=Actinomyces respiraculi TaxID=2744574 RepID=A0A7T0PXK1_9ACTO|nr:protease PrsW [Actinomyces respiraculi]QPL05710.1 protease PrsW [Actinomyces respiraculi]
MVRLLSRVAQLGQVGSLLLAVALVVVEGLAHALVPAVSLLAGLLVLVAVARTRTVSTRSLTMLLSASTVWALGIAVLTTALGNAEGLSARDDGAIISLAAFVEEPGKLLILLLPALVAPGRMRRMAASDWALMGYAAGAGFTIAEDSVRRLTTATNLWSILAELFDEGTHYSLNPLTSGSLERGLEAPFTGEWVEVMAVGHHVSTMLVAATLGLAIAAWRYAGRLGTSDASVSVGLWWRMLSVVGPVAALGYVITDHAAYNASVAWSGWVDEGGLLFGPLSFVWFICGMGHGQVPVVVLLLGLCLAVDAHRRMRAGFMGRVDPERGAVPPLSGVSARWREPLRAVVAVGVFAWSDLAVILSGYTRPDLTRAERMRRGRRVGQLILQVRRQAMSVTSPGGEPTARRRWALGALVVAAVSVAACLAVGVVIGRSIGPAASSPDDAVFFAGLLDGLASWWDGLNPAAQILLIALGVLALMSMGASAALAMGAVGVVTWFAGHGHGVAAFMRDPRAATASYVRNVTPGQLLMDVVDFATTFIPGSALGVGLRTAERSLSATVAARRSARLPDLASLFQMRDEALAARRAAEAHLKDLLPPGTRMPDFNKRNYEDTLDLLRRGGHDREALDQLREASENCHTARPRAGRITEVAGEVGGLQELERHGYTVPDAFRPQGLEAKPTGPRKVDMLAVSADRGSIHVPELKGGTGRLKTNPVRTLFEGRAPQGTPAYVRDRMLRDDRVIEFFRDNPDLWEGVKRGDITVTSDVISTPEAGFVNRGNPIDVDLASHPQIVTAIEQRIAALGSP